MKLCSPTSQKVKKSHKTRSIDVRKTQNIEIHIYHVHEELLRNEEKKTLVRRTRLSSVVLSLHFVKLIN